MARLTKTSSGHTENPRLWLQTIQLTIGFLVVVDTLAYVMGIYSLNILKCNLLLIATGLLGQIFTAKSRFFTANIQQASVASRDANAVIFGRRITIRSSKILTWDHALSLRLAIAAVLFMTVCYVCLSHPMLRQGFNLSGCFVGLAVIAVMTPTLAWLPAGLAMVNLLFAGPPPSKSLMLGITYALCLLVLIFGFALLLHIFATGEGRPDETTNTHQPLTEKTRSHAFRDLLKYGISMAIIAYAYCDWAAATRPETTNTKNHRSQSRATAPFVSSSGIHHQPPHSGRAGAAGESVVGSPLQNNETGDLAGSLRPDNNDSAPEAPPSSDQGGQGGQGGRGTTATGAGNNEDVSGNPRGADGTPEHHAEANKEGNMASTSDGNQARESIGDDSLPSKHPSPSGLEPKPSRKPQLQLQLQRQRQPKLKPPSLPKPKDLITALLAVAVIGVMIVFFMMRKTQRRTNAPGQNTRSKKTPLFMNPELRRKFEQDLLQATSHPPADPEAMRQQVVALYNQLLDAYDHTTLKRPHAMTPDEYGHYFSAAHPPKASAIRFVTDVYGRVFFGKQTPDLATFHLYVKAISKAQSL